MDENFEHFLTDCPDFNESMMVFLPNGLSGTDKDVGGFCTPEHIRPLNITNVGNRLPAIVVRMRLGTELERWTSPMQRGFSSEHSMRSNVVDFDEAMMEMALAQDKGAPVFCDFNTAFP
mmetsp:Transcript_57771/g.187559  ORF Transcript_57771/g.187559 Transcript_57771/m.187559 type:complete len:119 (+) Transcript_57771:227-583(+)